MTLHETLPWTKSPLIISAPMGGIAQADLAIAVTRAGGLGQIGAVDDMQALDTELDKVNNALPRHNGLLPIGVGILVFVSKLKDTMAILSKHRPAVIWLFAAPELTDYATWATSVRDSCPDSQLWVQVGNVEAALQVARECRPDVLSVQGADAGGHGFEKGAGLVSLLPEIEDTLKENGHDRIALVAAGGIAEGRSAAAAFVLGAQGVVMGTRFLSAPETIIHKTWQAAVVKARDGGQETVRSKLFDNLRGPNQWPVAYDGRSLRMESWDDYADGVDIEEIRRRHTSAARDESKGYGEGGKGRAAMWAGTGVGHVKAVQPAGEIVEEVRSSIRTALEAPKSRM